MEQSDVNPAWEFVPMRYGLTFWELKGVPHFHGTVEDHGDVWLARRSGNSAVPPIGSFTDLDVAKEKVEEWAREHLGWLVRTGMEQAAMAQRALLDLGSAHV